MVVALIAVPRIVRVVSPLALFIPPFSLSAQSGKHVEGHTVSLAASFVMLGAMAPRFIKSKKLWPAGLCTILGGANVPYQYIKTRQWME